MNVNNSNLVSALFSQNTGKSKNIFNPLEKIKSQQKNGYGEDRVELLNTQGIAGMCLHGKNPSEWQQTIQISDKGEQELFDMVKSEFIKNNGVLEGDTTKKTEVVSDYLRGIPEKDRLKASWTLDQLQFKFRSAFVSAVKQADPTWDFGKAIDRSVLEGITKESLRGTTNKHSSKGIDLLL